MLEALITAANSKSFPELPSLWASLVTKIKTEAKARAVSNYKATLSAALVGFFSHITLPLNIPPLIPFAFAFPSLVLPLTLAYPFPQLLPLHR